MNKKLANLNPEGMAKATWRHTLGRLKAGLKVTHPVLRNSEPLKAIGLQNDGLSRRLNPNESGWAQLNLLDFLRLMHFVPPVVRHEILDFLQTYVQRLEGQAIEDAKPASWTDAVTETGKLATLDSKARAKDSDGGEAVTATEQRKLETQLVRTVETLKGVVKR